MSNAGGSLGRFVVDVDIGGTFTDAIVFAQNLAKIFKVDTTPHQLSDCLQDVLVRAVTSFGLPDTKTFLRHTQVIRVSTSLSTNTLMERKGSHCGLLVTEGWKSSYLSQPRTIGTAFRLLSEDMVLEIETGIDAAYALGNGSSEDEIREKVQLLINRGATIIVVSLAGAETRPECEHGVKTIVRQYYPRHFIGSVPVLLGSQISLDADFLRRTNTAVMNAYCHRPIAALFYQIEEFLRGQGYTRPVLVVHSSGGSARVAKTKAISTINSGAAAGIFGVARLAAYYGLSNIVSVDMGGTTTEIGLLGDGAIEFSASPAFDGIPIDLTRAVASTLSIGGGSIAKIGPDGEVTLGPESAGAFPGPACYDLGGTWPTLTDAYLILGYLDENYFLGGQKVIKRGLAERVLEEKIGRPLGVSCEEAAVAVKSKAVEIIGNAILREIIPDRKAPSDFSIVAIGGGGGCIGADLAYVLGFQETYVFRQGSVFGAYGSSGMDITHVYESRADLEQFGLGQFRELICRQLNFIGASLQQIACNDMRGEGFCPEEIQFQMEIELSAPTLTAPIRIKLPNPFIWPENDWPTIMDLTSYRFEDDIGMEWHDLRVSRVFLRAIAEVPHTETVLPRMEPVFKAPHKGNRPIYLGPEFRSTAKAYEWDLLPVPCVLAGPAAIDSHDTTVWVPPNMMIEFDTNYNGIIRRKS